MNERMDLKKTATEKRKNNIVNKIENRNRKKKLMPKIWRDLQMKGTISTQKLNWYVSTITHVFLNQKKVNICEHTVKMASLEKDICDCRNVSVKLPWFYLCLWSEDRFILLARVSYFYSYFCVISTSVFSLSTCSIKYNYVYMETIEDRLWRGKVTYRAECFRQLHNTNELMICVCLY